MLSKERDIMRKILLLVVAFIIGMMAGGIALADPAHPIKVLINGRELVSDPPLIVHNDRIYVPLRAVSDALGGTATWDYYTQTAYIATPGNPEDIEIVGTPEFQKTVRDALNLLRDKDPEDYNFVGQYVRRIETIDRDYSAPGIYNMTVYISNKAKCDPCYFAEVVIHEAQHIKQKYSGVFVDTETDEIAAYSKGMQVLKRIGAPQQTIDQLQKLIDSKPWQN